MRRPSRRCYARIYYEDIDDEELRPEMEARAQRRRRWIARYVREAQIALGWSAKYATQQAERCVDKSLSRGVTARDAFYDESMLRR